MTKPHLKHSSLTDTLKPQKKEVIKIVLIDTMIHRGWWAADLKIDAELAWDLVALLGEFDKEWKEIESKEDLQAQPFFKDMIGHLKYLIRNNGTWLNKKIKDKKKELSQEAESKESKPVSE